MAKDPAVLFYTSDFLTGTLTMSDEQIGKYIKLLCFQHQKGILSEKDMMNICKTYDEEIWAKFVKCEEGYYNKRMREEADKRRAYSESRRNNKLKIKKAEHMTNISSSYEEHMENENEIVNEHINKDIIINKEKTQKIKIDKEPLVFISPDWESLWQGWADYKKTEHRDGYKSAKTEQVAINKLVEMSGGDLRKAQEIVKQSIANRWKGLFTIKQNANVTTKSNFDKYQQRYNELAEWADEYDRQRGFRPGQV